MKQPIYVNCIRDAKQPAAISCYQLIDDSRKLRNVASAVSREFANITPITNFLTCLDQLCIITKECGKAAKGESHEVCKKSYHGSSRTSQ